MVQCEERIYSSLKVCTIHKQELNFSCDFIHRIKGSVTTGMFARFYLEGEKPTGKQFAYSAILGTSTGIMKIITFRGKDNITIDSFYIGTKKVIQMA